MQNTINRNLLKYAVQTAITCPRCQQILDMRRAVAYDLANRTFRSTQRVACCKCFDAILPKLQAIQTEDPSLTLDAIDARDVFARKTRAKEVK